MTSKAASNLLKETGMKRSERDRVDDGIAASLILDSAISLIQNLNKLS